MERKRVAILISGRGSNMVALLKAAAAPDYPAEIVLVLSNKPEAAGLATAAAAGIATAAVNGRAYKGRKAEFEAAMQAELERHDVELICLAGFMRLLSPAFTARWHDSLINIHPSLLPAYPGLDTHARALADGVKQAGCTVHYVRAEMDSGPTILQAAVPVLPGDTPDDLAARVLAEEHRIYPEALALVASGRARVENEAVILAAPLAAR